MTGKPRPGPNRTLHIVATDTAEEPPEPTPNDSDSDEAVEALILARHGYRAAVDAAAAARLPSLTDFVD